MNSADRDLPSTATVRRSCLARTPFTSVTKTIEGQLSRAHGPEAAIVEASSGIDLAKDNRHPIMTLTAGEGRG